MLPQGCEITTVPLGLTTEVLAEKRDSVKDGDNFSLSKISPSPQKGTPSPGIFSYISLIRVMSHGYSSLFNTTIGNQEIELFFAGTLPL